MKRNPSIGELRRWWVSLGRTNRSFKRTRLGAIRAEWRSGKRSRWRTLHQMLRRDAVCIHHSTGAMVKALEDLGGAARNAARALNGMTDSLGYAVQPFIEKR